MNNRLITTILLLTLCCLNAVAQRTINVPKDAPGISEAVRKAQSGDTVFLSAGIYTDSVHISNKRIIIQGELGGTSVLSPENNGKSFVLQDAQIEFVHLRFDDFEHYTQPPNFGISASNSDVTISNCEFHGIFSPVSINWGNLTIRNSVFSNTRNGVCIQQNGGTFSIYNNLLFELSYTAVIFNRAHGEFFHNTLVGSSPSKYRGMFINSDSISHIYNNIISGFGVGIHLSASDSNELKALRIHHNNIYDMAAPYWYEFNENLSLPIKSGAFHPNPGTGEISVIPGFVSSDDYNFTLQSTSECVDAGSGAYTIPVTKDLAGKSRVIGSNPDIGAYEFDATTGISASVRMQDSKVDVYPNPATGQVTIELPKTYTGSIEIIDGLGRTIQTLSVRNQSTVHVTLPALKGLYFIRTTNGVLLKSQPVLKF